MPTETLTTKRSFTTEEAVAGATELGASVHRFGPAEARA